MKKWLLILLVVTVGMALSLSRVQANSAPPPAVVWFYFELAQGDYPELAGLQLVGCESVACQSPVLLQQYGECSLPGCLPGAVLPSSSDLPETSRLECFGAHCRSQSYGYGRPFFRLAAQLKESGAQPTRLVTSLNSESLPEGMMKTDYWRVVVQADSLELSPTVAFEIPSASDYPFGSTYLLTLVVELVVALLLWATWLRHRSALHPLLLCLMVALATTLTYPLVYLSPALLPFSQAGERFLFIMSLIFSLTAGMLLLPVFTARDNRQRILRGFAFGLALLLNLVLFLFITFSVLYGSGDAVAPAGLPLPLAFGLAELYAFGWEAVLLRLWSRKRLAWCAALLLSLTINLASLAAGMVFLTN